MSNGSASLPAGNSSLASTLLANPDPGGPPPVTSPALTSSNGTGRADQSMDGMSESATSSDQPNGSSPTAPSPASSPGRDPVPTLATAQDNTPPDDPAPAPAPASPTSQGNNETDANEDDKSNSPAPTPAPSPEPAPNGSTGDQEEEEEEDVRLGHGAVFWNISSDGLIYAYCTIMKTPLLPLSPEGGQWIVGATSAKKRLRARKLVRVLGLHSSVVERA
ncbi:hypothetical protein B0T16DRAFT_395293 [Cercophora newfieldiana]|uniref:Uncharacterized protein n=1 Tax=Cercophora newfieldiana TaxID=92897 RepID=A0AA39XST5_9PEZI|nr:hypothetical protein B0T16DRAFT_395293 [Cercophora newfieldiana]